MKTLILPVKREYFEQIKAGTKTEEYRIDNAYWRKRLRRKGGTKTDPILTGSEQFDQVVITLGYPPKSDTSRRLIFPWRGFTVKTITHPHFGAAPVRVFAVRLQPKEP